MNDEQTRDLPARRSFEERVFARLDAIDARLDSVVARFDSIDTRLDSLDARVEKLESRALDTKPIWESALAEILEVRKGVEVLNRKIDILNHDVMPGSCRSAPGRKTHGQPGDTPSIVLAY